jgi:hypothetical protein
MAAQEAHYLLDMRGLVGSVAHALVQVPVHRQRRRCTIYYRIQQLERACKHTSAYVSIRQDTSGYVSTRQHTSTYVRIRQDTSGYVRIRQDKSAYVTMPAVWGPSIHIQQCLWYIYQLSAVRGIRNTYTAYVSIRQHTSAYVTMAMLHILNACSKEVSAHTYGSICTIHTIYTTSRVYILLHMYVSIRQHTSAYVGIRQHTSAYVSVLLPLAA